MPLGIFVTQSEAEAEISGGLQLIRTLFPANSFAGRGIPSFWMSDDCAGLRNSISQVYETSSLWSWCDRNMFSFCVGGRCGVGCGGASNTISVLVPRSTIRLALAAWIHIGHIAREQTTRIVAIHRMVSRRFVFHRTLMLRGAVFCIARRWVSSETLRTIEYARFRSPK